LSLPNAVTYTRDLRDSSDEISQARPLAIGENIWINDPNENKLLSRIMRTAGNQAVDQVTFGHLEDAPNANWVTYSGADETSSQATTGLAITGVGSRCAEGTRLVNARNKEVIRLTADAASANVTAAVARNFGRGVSTDYLLNGDKLFIIPPAMYEGFTMGKGLTNAKVYKSFNTGILSYPVRITGTEGATKQRGGSPFERGLFKSWKQSKDQMEAELLYGSGTLDTTTYAQSMHAATGLYDVIETNVFTIGGTLSRRDLWDILTEVSLLNKMGMMIVCSQFMKNLIAEWALELVEYVQGTDVDGIEIDKVKTPVGTFEIVVVDFLNQEEHLMGDIFLIPSDPAIDYVHLEANGRNRDIAYKPVDREEVDQDEGHIMGEYGWEYYLEEKFAYITGIEF